MQQPLSFRAILLFMSNFTVLDLLDLDLKEKNHLKLECVAGRAGLSREISEPKLFRPGLALTGYFNEFDDSAIQILGRNEQSYISLLESRNDYSSLDKLFTMDLPCIVFLSGGQPSEHITELAEKTATAILTTPLESAEFSRMLYAMLSDVFAETITIHGVLVEVYGIGILITGDSGVGKSETALELIEHGHRIISDDTVKLKSISGSFLIGSGENKLLAHHMEIRGLGIINLTNLFGVGAIRDTKQVQLEVQLENWDSAKDYDRLGDQLTATYLGISIPKIIIPVRPGRNVPLLIETAARNERMKILGYHSAKEFDRNVLQWLESEEARKLYFNQGGSDGQ